MKNKLIIAIVVILLTIITIFITLNFINIDRKGNITDYEIVIEKSEIYSKYEIQSAIDVVLDKFKDFPATLNKIWYDEEKSQNASEEWAKQYNADQAIVLYSNFKTYLGDQPANSGFNPNSEYENWSWILVRNNKEKWELKTFGY